MSYRTCINGNQLFGNDECYDTWIEFIKSQGIPVSEEDCYDGYIMDFMGAVEACEKIVMDIEAERDENRAKLNKFSRQDPFAMQQAESLFDLSDIKKKITEPEGTETTYRPRLFDTLYDRIDCGYLFLPIMLYAACKKDLILDPTYPSRFRAYKLKPGKRIRVHAG